jgi:hypothetical protein
MPISSGLVDMRESLFTFREIEHLYTQRVYESLNLDFWDYDFEEQPFEDRVKILLVNSGEDAYKTVNGFMSGGPNRALLFTLMVNSVRGADTPYVMSIPLQKKEMDDVLADFESYIRQPDPELCEKYSFDGNAYPAPNWMAALDRLPWGQLGVTREEAIACVQLQNRVFSEQDVVKVGTMVDRITEEVASGTFDPALYRLTPYEDTKTGLYVPQTSVRHDGLDPFTSFFTGWSLFTQGETIGGFIYDNGGGLYRVMKENEVMILSFIAATTMSSVMLHTRIPSGMGVGKKAIAIAGMGVQTIIPYIYKIHTIVPMTKDGIVAMFASTRSVVPSTALVWSAGASVSTVVVTTAKEYPKAVLVAGAAWYFKDEIKSYGAGMIGLVVMVIGGVALVESGFATKMIRTKRKRRK